MCLERCDFFQYAVLGHLMTPYHSQILEYQLTHQHSMILAPRNSGKSFVNDKGYVIWRLLNNPNLRICIVSRSENQAKHFLRGIKTHFESNEDLKKLFGDLVGPIWNETEITLANRKSFESEPNVFVAGVGGGIVSKHFDEIIADDLVDLENSQTDTQREFISTWFRMSLMPTLMPDGSLRVLGTRYHPEDIYGELAKVKKKTIILPDGVKREEIKYANKKIGPNVLVVPAIQKVDVEITDEDRKLFAEQNSAPPTKEVSFWEDQYPLEDLQALRQENEFIFSLQYQNDAKVTSQEIIKRTDVEPYVWTNYLEVMSGRKPDGTSRRLFIYQGVDPAISLKQTADYFAHQTIGVDPDTEEVFDLENFKGHLSFPDQVEYIVAQWKKWNPVAIGIEAVAYQAALAGQLRSVSIWMQIQEIKTKLDKVMRAKLFSSLTQNHKLHLAPSSIDLLETLVNMPNVEHDDDFDAIFFACEAARLVSSVDNPFVGFINTNGLAR